MPTVSFWRLKRRLSLTRLKYVYWFELVASNGEPLCHGEQHPSADLAREAIERVKRNAEVAEYIRKDWKDSN